MLPKTGLLELEVSMFSFFAPNSRGFHDLNQAVLNLFPNGREVSGSFIPVHVGVSKNSDTPKWMVYNGKPY